MATDNNGKDLQTPAAAFRRPYKTARRSRAAPRNASRGAQELPQTPSPPRAARRPAPPTSGPRAEGMIDNHAMAQARGAFFRDNPQRPPQSSQTNRTTECTGGSQSPCRPRARVHAFWRSCVSPRPRGGRAICGNPKATEWRWRYRYRHIPLYICMPGCTISLVYMCTQEYVGVYRCVEVSRRV